MPKDTLPEWERVLSSAARLQQLLPEAVLVGGTASALYAQHRRSHDADHVLSDLRTRFDQVLAELESTAGWMTARAQRPVMILGNLDGIETGVRQLIRKEPLETTRIEYQGEVLTVPTQAEMLRIKAVLILKRNATRDYLDFIALADHMGAAKVAKALEHFDTLYPQPNDQSASQQLVIQLAEPLPYDLEDTKLNEYKDLQHKWREWESVRAACAQCAAVIFDSLPDGDLSINTRQCE